MLSLEGATPRSHQLHAREGLWDSLAGPRKCVSRLAVLAYALTVAGSSSLWAQTQASDFYYYGAEKISLDFVPDTLGLSPQEGVTTSVIVDSLFNRDIRGVDTLPEGLLLVGLPGPTTREELQALARQIEENYPTLIRKAGLVFRHSQYGHPLILIDQFIVQFHPNATRDQIDSLNAIYGVATVAVTPLATNHFLLSVTERSPGDALALAQLYHESVLTVFAHPNFLEGDVSTSLAPDDPLLAQQWHLNITGTTTGHVNAFSAWNITSGDPDVVIAVIELGGFEVTHPDFASNLWMNPDEPNTDLSDPYPGDVHGWNFAICEGDPGEGCGDPDLVGLSTHHATAVAGLIAALRDNGIGVTGVCPNCRLMLLRVGYQGWYAKARAFAYAREHGAYVINNSWVKFKATPSTDLETEIENAAVHGRGERGSIVVFSLGNVKDPSVFPGPDRCTGAGEEYGALESVIAVGASNNKDERTFFSPEGDCLDLLAPGAWESALFGVTTTDAFDTAGYNYTVTDLSFPCPSIMETNQPTDLEYTSCFGGTSTAAAIVSGIAGLMLSANPCLTRQQVQDILQATAVKIDASNANYDASTGWSSTHGYGRVDAYEAVKAAGSCECECSGTGGSQVEPAVDGNMAGAGAVEIGARLGLAGLMNTPDRAVFNVPGGGPLAEPVMYVAGFPGNHWMLEGQLGFAFATNSGLPNDLSLVAAFNPAFLLPMGAGALYGGGSLAIQHTDIGGATNTYGGGGGVVGYRFLPKPFLALRIEGLYRYWPSPGVHELGIAFGFGVVLN